MVYGIRERRHEPPHISLARKIFYRVNKSIADSDILVDVAEFGLISAEVRDAVVVAHGGVSRALRGLVVRDMPRGGVPVLPVPQDKILVLAGETVGWL